MHELVSKSSGNRDSSLGQEARSKKSTSGSSESSLSLIIGSSGKGSEMSQMICVDFAPMTDEYFGTVAYVHDQTERGIGGKTMK